MSTLSKIFVVLNFLLAFAFMIASLTLYAKRVDWVAQTQASVQTRNQMERELLEVNEQLAKATQDLRDEKEANALTINGNERVIVEKENQIRSLETKNSNLQTNLSNINDRIQDLQKQLAQKEDRNKELQLAIDDLIKKNQEYIEKAEFAETRAIELMADLKQSELELKELAKEQAELAKKVTETNIALQQYVKTFGPLPDQGVTPINPIQGRVLKVEEPVNLVILNVGKDKEVKKGMEFVISRGGTYVGKVRVRNVYENMCSATFIGGVMKGLPSRNDLAQTIN